jgi:hypothetical protein
MIIILRHADKQGSAKSYNYFGTDVAHPSHLHPNIPHTFIPKFVAPEKRSFITASFTENVFLIVGYSPQTVSYYRLLDTDFYSDNQMQSLSIDFWKMSLTSNWWIQPIFIHY